QEMTAGSGFLHALNDQVFPSQPLYTALIGANGTCSFFVPGRNDCVVGVDSADFSNVHSPPTMVETAVTTRAHWTETQDATTILWAINRGAALQGVDRVLISVASP